MWRAFERFIVLALRPFSSGAFSLISVLAGGGLVVILARISQGPVGLIAALALLLILVTWAGLRLQREQDLREPVVFFTGAFDPERRVISRELPKDEDGVIGEPIHRDHGLAAFVGGMVKNDPPGRPEPARAADVHVSLVVTDAVSGVTLLNFPVAWLPEGQGALLDLQNMAGPQQRRDLEPNGQWIPFPLGYMFSDEPGALYVASGNLTATLGRDLRLRLGPGFYAFFVKLAGVNLRDTEARYEVRMGEVSEGNATLNLTLIEPKDGVPA